VLQWLVNLVTASGVIDYIVFSSIALARRKVSTDSPSHITGISNLIPLESDWLAGTIFIVLFYGYSSFAHGMPAPSSLTMH
jgi:uncharacterized membrane protein SirB2